MQPIFRAAPVTAAEAQLVFSLVRLAEPGITAARWNDYARRFFSGRKGKSGLLGIRDQRGIFHGMFAYTVERSWRCPRRLRITDILMARLPGTHFEDVLIDGADELAREHACGEIVIDLPPERQDLSRLAESSLASRRFRPIAITYSRPVLHMHEGGKACA